MTTKTRLSRLFRHAIIPWILLSSSFTITPLRAETDIVSNPAEVAAAAASAAAAAANQAAAAAAEAAEAARHALARQETAATTAPTVSTATEIAPSISPSETTESIVVETSEEPVSYLPQISADILWLAFAAVLVFFMQCGFAMLETGMTRAKNACNIMMKNMLDFTFASLGFWALGFAFMYGESGNSFIGWDKALFFLDAASDGQNSSLSASWLFQVMFCGTAATIVGGAMAERTKFVGYVIYSLFISILIYPIAGHWIWSSDGWLATMGMRDFAGSTVVHSVGAWAGMAGAIILGARLGKYSPEGKSRPIPGHNLPLATLGCFILWFGWFGFNAGSTLSAVDGLAYVAVTTLIASSCGAAAATITTWLKFGKPDLTMTINGCLAGLVSITAPCASVSTVSAAIIGAVGGVLVVFAALFIEQKLKIDDPVGAISVHGVCGAWGTLSIGLFGNAAIDALYWGEESAISNGLLLGGGSDQLLIQAAGVISVFAFTFMTSYVLFSALSKTVGIRVTKEEELEGLDLGEHGNEAYPDFQQYEYALEENAPSPSVGA